MGIVGIDGIGGDYTAEGSPGHRALAAVSQVSEDLKFRIALPNDFAMDQVRLPENIEYFKADSLDAAIAQFSAEGIPAVTAFNVQKGVFSMIENKIKGIRRVPFAAEIPRADKGAFLFLDVGVNSDLCDITDSGMLPSLQYEKKAKDIVNFARLGSLYMEIYRKTHQPRVGLLSNGHEPSKGNAFTRKCYELLSQEKGFLFKGYVEPTETESIDVLVTDGFTGNIGLKCMEAAIRFVKKKLGLMGKIIKLVRRSDETSEYTGAFVLGLTNNFVIVKVHGAARAKDFATAYRKAADFSKPVEAQGCVYQNLSAAIESEFNRRYLTPAAPEA
jgi:fatty acid/phospholipid biosynthesis enzyme